MRKLPGRPPRTGSPPSPPRLGGFCLEVFQQLSERLVVAVCSPSPALKIADYLTQNVRLPRVLPLIENIVINTNWKQDLLAFAILSIEGALDLSEDRAALEG